MEEKNCFNLYCLNLFVSVNLSYYLFSVAPAVEMNSLCSSTVGTVPLFCASITFLKKVVFGLTTRIFYIIPNGFESATMLKNEDNHLTTCVSQGGHNMKWRVIKQIDQERIDIRKAPLHHTQCLLRHILKLWAESARNWPSHTVIF